MCFAHDVKLFLMFFSSEDAFWEAVVIDMDFASFCVVDFGVMRFECIEILPWKKSVVGVQCIFKLLQGNATKIVMILWMKLPIYFWPGVGQFISYCLVEVLLRLRFRWWTSNHGPISCGEILTHFAWFCDIQFPQIIEVDVTRIVNIVRDLIKRFISTIWYPMFLNWRNSFHPFFEINNFLRGIGHPFIITICFSSKSRWLRSTIDSLALPECFIIFLLYAWFDLLIISCPDVIYGDWSLATVIVLRVHQGFGRCR